MKLNCWDEEREGQEPNGTTLELAKALVSLGDD
jgi:hypothetical protein